jgi:hypothetical protein
MTVGEARDFLSSSLALAHPIKLLQVARGISQILHQEVDFEHDGASCLEVMLPEETERLAEIGRRFVDNSQAARDRQHS